MNADYQIAPAFYKVGCYCVANTPHRLVMLHKTTPICLKKTILLHPNQYYFAGLPIYHYRARI